MDLPLLIWLIDQPKMPGQVSHQRRQNERQDDRCEE